MTAAPRLAGRVAIVTGAGTGIGKETAARLAAEGATVVLCGRTQATLDAAVAEVKRAGGHAVARRCDIERAAEARELVAWTLATLGRVDVLVNNAGHSNPARSIRWISEEEWRSVLDVNLTAVWVLTQAVLPGMLERGEGTIVTVTSAAAIRASGLSGPAYSAAKAGARNFMANLHAELRNRGIRATTIVPAEVDTPILDKRPKPPDAAARATMMRPEDVAEAILLAVTLPQRTVIEELVMSPTTQRDITADVAAGRRVGAPPGVQ